MNHQSDPLHQHAPAAKLNSNQKFERGSAPRPTSSSFFSFLRWFRPGEGDSNVSDSEDEGAPASPLFSSCDSLDSVFSTATAASFAFVPPATYKPFGAASVPEKFIAPGHETQTYRRRLKQRDQVREIDRNLTLRKKYKLFATETLTSTKLEYKNYCELSLPHIKQVDNCFEENIKCHRRSASCSSKDRKARVHLHVKGKRRAPLPPMEDLKAHSLETNSNSDLSTNTRKKRKAPLPPLINNEVPMKNNNNLEEIVSNDSLRLEKGVLKPAKKINAIEELAIVKQIKDSAPVSPKPWYKRTGNCKDLRKDKALEKRADKEKYAFTNLNQFKICNPNDGNSRFSFFSKLNDKSDKKDNEKRKSGMLMLANISELDREAAEIISIQHAREEAMATAQDNRFYNIPSFIRPPIMENEANHNDIPERQSAKELISRFNAITNVTKITINAAFLNTKNTKFLPKGTKFSNRNLESSENHKSQCVLSGQSSGDTPPMKRSIFSFPDSYLPTCSSPHTTKVGEDIGKGNVDMEEQNVVKQSPELQKASDVEINKTNISEKWICKHCSLQNSFWRITCYGCKTPNPNLELSNNNVDHPKSPVTTTRKTFGNWEKEIKNDFSNKTLHTIDESQMKKSSSDKSVFKGKIIDSNLETAAHQKVILPNNKKMFSSKENLNIKDEVENKNNKILFKPNMEEIRKIRLERFSANLERLPKALETNSQEQDILFKKLREMKNSLHEAAGGAKTDVVVNEETNKDKLLNGEGNILSSKDDKKLGAIKKTQFVSDKQTNECYVDKPTSKVKKIPDVAMQAELEDVKSRSVSINKPLKVSSSCQTSGVIRKACDAKPAIAESTYEMKSLVPLEQSNELRIKNRMYELIGPRDFANRKEHKIRTIEDNCENTYENIHLHSLNNRFDKLTQQIDKTKEPDNLQKILQNSDLTINNQPLTVNKLLRDLENSIAEGKQALAAQLAKDLANMKINCSVTRQKCTPQSQQHQDMTLSFYVEDKISHQGPFSVQVPINLTIQQLKEKIALDLEIPIIIQRWIIGSQLASDNSKTLAQLMAGDNSTHNYLYLVAPAAEEQMPKINYELFKNVQDLHTHVPNNSSNNIDEDELNGNELSCKHQPENIAKEKKQFDWTCTTCTLNNSSFSDECSTCCATKPFGVMRPNKISNNTNFTDQHYLQLLNLDNMDVVTNIEPFKCSVCFDNFCKGEGIILRECLHTFCRECLANNVRYSDEAEVKCPYRDDQYTCNYVMQEREIKALVSPEVYDQHLAKSIAQAENRIENAFHCKTPNCLGWCIFEDNVNLFMCPVCSQSNCLTCQAIHTNLDCRQYQEKMKQASETNVDAKRTKEMLKELVDKGEAMTCPTCQVILMKKWGCDWLLCSMCKTEICWVTRGPRWGPKGKGDVTGGCKCGIDGRKCHVKCNYCH